MKDGGNRQKNLDLNGMKEDEEIAVARQPRGDPETTQKGERTHFHDWGSQWCQLGRDYST